MNQLETAKKGVSQYPDLVSHIEDCINQAREDLFGGDEEDNFNTRKEKREEKKEGIKEAKKEKIK